MVEAAFRGPLDVTKRGKRKFVLMTAEQFDRLTGTGPQRAHQVEELTGPERDEILARLDAVAQEEGYDD